MIKRPAREPSTSPRTLGSGSTPSHAAESTGAAGRVHFFFAFLGLGAVWLRGRLDTIYGAGARSGAAGKSAEARQDAAYTDSVCFSGGMPRGERAVPAAQ